MASSKKEEYLPKATPYAVEAACGRESSVGVPHGKAARYATMGVNTAERISGHRMPEPDLLSIEAVYVDGQGIKDGAGLRLFFVLGARRCLSIWSYAQGNRHQ